MKKTKIVSYFIFLGTTIFLNMNFVSALTGECAVCGGNSIAIPLGLPRFVSGLINVVQILVPIIIILMGIVDFIKAVISGDDKVFKETTTAFVRKLIAGVAIFLIVAVIKLAFGIAGEEGENALSCVSCFLDADTCTVQTCPKRVYDSSDPDGNDDSDESGEVDKSCSDYDYYTCPEYDSFGNRCEAIESMNVCRKDVIDSDCSDYTVADCPEISESGSYCTLENVGAGSARICVVDTSKDSCKDDVFQNVCSSNPNRCMWDPDVSNSSGIFAGVSHVITGQSFSGTCMHTCGSYKTQSGCEQSELGCKWRGVGENPSCVPNS